MRYHEYSELLWRHEAIPAMKTFMAGNGVISAFSFYSFIECRRSRFRCACRDTAISIYYP
jgi:hypothetical protein